MIISMKSFVIGHNINTRFGICVLWCAGRMSNTHNFYSNTVCYKCVVLHCYRVYDILQAVFSLQIVRVYRLPHTAAQLLAYTSAQLNE